MLQEIYAHQTIGITDLKRGDTNFISEIDEPVAILKRDSVQAYLVPPRLMAYFIEKLEDIELTKIANERLSALEKGKSSRIAVKLDEL